MPFSLRFFLVVHPLFSPLTLLVLLYSCDRVVCVCFSFFFSFDAATYYYFSASFPSSSERTHTFAVLLFSLPLVPFRCFALPSIFFFLAAVTPSCLPVRKDDQKVAWCSLVRSFFVFPHFAILYLSIRATQLSLSPLTVPPISKAPPPLPQHRSYATHFEATVFKVPTTLFFCERREGSSKNVDGLPPLGFSLHILERARQRCAARSSPPLRPSRHLFFCRCFLANVLVLWLFCCYASRCRRDFCPCFFQRFISRVDTRTGCSSRLTSLKFLRAVCF